MIRSILRLVLWLTCGTPIILVCIGIGAIAYLIGGECALLECPPNRTAAASLSVNPAVRHYYANAPGVRVLCGLPSAPATFAHGTVTQRYAGCTITGRYSVRANAIPTPTARATAPPAPTMTPLPTSTPVPTSTSAPTATALPHPTATPDCWADYDRCLLSLINGERAAHGVAPLADNPQQDPRSTAHAAAMEATGSIWHMNPAYPQDSFPATIYCYPFCDAAENVGEASGPEAAAILFDFNQMLAEPWTPGCLGNHHCSIDSPSYHTVGIGIVYAGGAVWVVEDFVG